MKKYRIVEISYKNDVKNYITQKKTIFGFWVTYYTYDYTINDWSILKTKGDKYIDLNSAKKVLKELTRDEKHKDDIRIKSEKVVYEENI